MSANPGGACLRGRQRIAGVIPQSEKLAVHAIAGEVDRLNLQAVPIGRRAFACNDEINAASLPSGLWRPHERDFPRNEHILESDDPRKPSWD